MSGPLRLGVIYTIGPYLLPELVKNAIQRVPQMPLMLQENFTAKLLDMLRMGELDCAIMAEPFPDTGLAVAPLYDEPFLAAVPAEPPLRTSVSSITAEELKNETMLLLGTGHCFRDHVLEVCPEYARFASNAEGIRKSFEGSSAGDHQVHGGLGHGRDGGAAAVSVPKPKAADPHQAMCPSQPPVPTRAASCWPGAAPSRATRPLPRCATAIYACDAPRRRTTDGLRFSLSFRVFPRYGSHRRAGLCPPFKPQLR